MSCAWNWPGLLLRKGFVRWLGLRSMDRGSGSGIGCRMGRCRRSPGFASYREAAGRAADVESEQRTGTFVDPRLAQTLVGEWVRQWAEVHDVGAGTWAKYDAHLRNHILPRFGAMALCEVSRMTVKGWVKSLRRSLAEATVADVVSLLSTIFNEAVDEGLIGANPCRRLRVHTGEQGERPHASAAQIPVLTARASFMDGVMIITAAYTGMRWGELAGLQWARTDLDTGSLVIDAKDGALHEVNGTLKLGPPKTKASASASASARTVHLPPFLIALRGELHDSDPMARFVFTAPEGGWHRRANFRRRVWLPAVAGDPQRGWTPIAPGSAFS
jgi:integrase